jgi:hypothetical protein
MGVVIQKGMMRLVSPFVAAKFAVECHNAVKNHVPVRSHWKKYKGIVGSSLTITIEFR